MRIDLLAEIGDGQLMGVPAQELDAEVGLQLGQLAADGGFGHPQKRCRLREAAALHHFAEHQHGVQVERHGLFHRVAVLFLGIRVFQICNRVLRGCALFRANRRRYVRACRLSPDDVEVATMSQEALVAKPESGHWTDAYPDLGRGPVSLEDCVSEEFYEKEREHVFKKTWLYVGRVEQVPRSGSYFTRELKFLNTSIIIVRGKDGVVRAMHNVCPHRGNKMLWEDDPFKEVQGRAPLLYCRFHGWRYNLDGTLHSATRKDLLLDFDADSCRVPAIQCEVWEGFIFINLNPRQHRVGARLPRRARARHRGLSLRRTAPGVPVQGRIAVQLEDLRRRLRGELPRARICTPRRSATSPRRPKRRSTSRIPFTDALAYQLKGPHRMFSFSGEPSRKTPYSKPIECVMEASAAGPWNKRIDRGPMPPGINPTRSEKYGFDSYPVLPELRADLRCVRLHGPHPLADGAALAHLRNRDVLPAARPRTRNGWARS